MNGALISFASKNEIDPSILAAVESADALVANSQKQLIEQSLKTKEAAELMLQAKNQQSLELIAENRALQKLNIVQQEEIAALKAEAEMAKRLLAEQTERAAANEQKLHLQLLEAIKSKEEAVRLTAQIGEDRLLAVNQQMQTLKQQFKASLYGEVWACGHRFSPEAVKLLGLQVATYCSCHAEGDISGYYWGLYCKNSDSANLYLRMALAKALTQKVEIVEKLTREMSL